MTSSDYNNKVFAQGLHGLLRATWKLRLMTPLAIRNGLSIKYSEPKASKSRGLRLRFKWQEPDETDYEVAALHFGYEVVEGGLQAFHFVPPSSVRGALRSWTINHLVHPQYRKDMTPPEHDDDPEQKKQKAYLEKVKEALNNPQSGYPIVAKLFGLAFETRDAAKEMAHAGRIRVETERFANTQAQPIAINGVLDEGSVGPRNVDRQMAVRNPLDRMTHGSKEGGLHHFLEFCTGESFNVLINILNPVAQDLGLLSLWVREMNEGMLRLGALSSIGRGRVTVTEHSYRLWQRANLSPIQEFAPTAEARSSDVLSDVWREYELPVDKLVNFEQSLHSLA
jgi:hypothetical protein